MGEMATYLPISSPFIRFAGRYVDEAFGVAAGWNFFVFEAALVPFEVTACNVIVSESVALLKRHILTRCSCNSGRIRYPFGPSLSLSLDSICELPTTK